MAVNYCPKCNSILVLKSGKWGNFLACPRYPACKHTQKVAYVKEDVTITPVDHKGFNPTSEQKAIENETIKQGKTTLIEAGPGTGKSRTLIYLLSQLPQNAKALLLAFNTSIVDELKGKIDRTNTEIKTIHSFGLSVLKSNIMGRITIENDKTPLYQKKYYAILANSGKVAEDDIKKLYNPLVRVLDMLNANLLDVNEKNVNDMILFYGIEFSEGLENYNVVDLVAYLKEEGQKDKNYLTFSDMVSFALQYSKAFPVFDWVFVDECQDLSLEKLMLIISLKVANPLVKFVFVGDENQSINGFAGANIASIQDIKTKVNPSVLPLSQTHRIPKCQVEEVLNPMFPNIRLTSEKEGGYWKEINENEYFSELLTFETALTVCRYNAPLVSPCLSLLKMGKKAIIKGRDIGQDLIYMIAKNDKDHTLPGLYSELESYYNQQYIKYQNAKDKSFLQFLADKIEVIAAIGESVNSVNELIEKIDSIFSNGSADYIFSSIHKAKGLEHETVFALNYNTWQSKKAVTDEQIKQEHNAKWVGLTRSKNALILVTEEEKAKK